MNNDEALQKVSEKFGYDTKWFANAVSVLFQYATETDMKGIDAALNAVLGAIEEAQRDSEESEDGVGMSAAMPREDGFDGAEFIERLRLAAAENADQIGGLEDEADRSALVHAVFAYSLFTSPDFPAMPDSEAGE